MVTNKSTFDAALDAAFSSVNGTSFASITALTSVNLQGKKADVPLKGRVSKLVVNAPVVLFSTSEGYQNRVNKMLGIEQGEDAEPFVMSAPKWGERVPNTPIYFHSGNGKRYVQVARFQKPSNVFYFVDGREATEDELKDIKANLDAQSEKKANSSGQNGLKDKVIINTYAYDSIIQVKANGSVFTRKTETKEVSEKMKQVAQMA